MQVGNQMESYALTWLDGNDSGLHYQCWIMTSVVHQVMKRDLGSSTGQFVKSTDFVRLSSLVREIVDLA